MFRLKIKKFFSRSDFTRRNVLVARIIVPRPRHQVADSSARNDIAGHRVPATEALERTGAIMKQVALSYLVASHG